MTKTNQYQIIKAEFEINNTCQEMFGHDDNLKIFIPSAQFGHMSINAPIIYAKSHNKSIEEVFVALEPKLIELDFIDRIELVKGFCNIYFTDAFLAQSTLEILDHQANYGAKSPNNIKVNVEYISANPTGDLHIGHLRGIYGDILARFLTFIGYDVTREYYVNNMGNQIQILGKSVFFAYATLVGLDCPKPDELYPGEHINAIAEEIAKTSKEYTWDKDHEFFIKTAVSKMLERIKGELKILNIEHDIWRYESEVYEGGYIQEAIDKLTDSGYIIEDVLGDIKSKRGQASNAIVKVFKGMHTEPKAVTKSDGSYTYFGADIGYHFMKIQEGYSWLIDSFGADHSLHAQTLAEVMNALDKTVRFDPITFQVVKFRKNGEELKLSKRGGVTLKPSELLEHMPDPNILRFVMASKPHNTHFVIDMENIAKISAENPFFDIQYAHARSASLIRKASKSFKSLNLSKFQLDHCTASNRELVYLLAQWPRELETIEQTLAIHAITNYLQKLAKKFNSIWSEKDFRWIIADDESITSSRLALVLAFKYTVASALAILGINAYDEIQ